MASPEVCSALPKMTWSISAGSVCERFRASREATTPRSMAEMSENTPLYSAIGVRAPSRMTISSMAAPARNLSHFRGGVELERKLRVPVPVPENGAATMVQGDPPQTVSASCRPGLTLGRYLVVEKIGSGGFGAVYRGLDPVLRRD